MNRIVASYRALGPACKREFHMPAGPVSQREHRVWCVDTIHARVAAVEADDALWLTGDVIFVIANGTCEPVALTEVTPPGLDAAGPVRLDPQRGARVVVIAGAARAPDPRMLDRDGLLDAVLSTPRRGLATRGPSSSPARRSRRPCGSTSSNRRSSRSTRRRVSRSAPCTWLVGSIVRAEIWSASPYTASGREPCAVTARAAPTHLCAK